MAHVAQVVAASPRRGVLGSRYDDVASNTIDYWMLPEEPGLTAAKVWSAVAAAEVTQDSSLQLYVHVPFCAQRCTFCAFSGGNSLSFKQTDRYSQLLAAQIKEVVSRAPVQGLKMRSVHVGGGSPDLLGVHIRRVLRAVRDLPSVDASTEISVEFTLSTTEQSFIDALVEHGVTKASFGIQTVDPVLRGYMRQPKDLRHLPDVLKWIDGRIPVVNADLITCLPGQTLRQSDMDLRTVMGIPEINCISSYLLTPGASPSLMSGLMTNQLPPRANPEHLALMRLNTYGAFLREGWVRRGTNTYVDPSRMAPESLARVSGNECIGQSHYEAFLLAAGASSIGSMPGVRIEQTTELDPWCEAVERGDFPFDLKSCSTAHQRDTALWCFPLRYEGLPHHRYDRLVEKGAISREQIEQLRSMVEEGLVTVTADGYHLTLLGEVFMGQLVRELKSPEGRRAVDSYIDEGAQLGQALAGKLLKDSNVINNRQLARELLSVADQKRVTEEITSK